MSDYTNGYEAGINQGRIEGYNEGQSRGYQDGLDDGYGDVIEVATPYMNILGMVWSKEELDWVPGIGVPNTQVLPDPMKGRMV